MFWNNPNLSKVAFSFERFQLRANFSGTPTFQRPKKPSKGLALFWEGSQLLKDFGINFTASRKKHGISALLQFQLYGFNYASCFSVELTQLIHSIFWSPSSMSMLESRHEIQREKSRGVWEPFYFIDFLLSSFPLLLVY